MRLAVFPHNLCWPSPRSPSGFATHGGIVLQIGCLAELFGATRVVMSCVPPAARAGEMPVTGRNLEVVPLRPLPRSRAWRLLASPFWMPRTGVRIVREMMAADAVFALVPGEIGTFVLLLALVLRRPLLVRYIIDWSAPRSSVDRVERWLLERFAGGRIVVLITGDGEAPPSARNRHLRWTFSTTLSEEDLAAATVPRALPESGPLRLVIVARQEVDKGTDILLRSLPLIAPELGSVELAVVGDGSALPRFRALAQELGLEDRVRFHGQVDHTQVLALLRAAHLYCLPTAGESFGKGVIEALGCGLPVVTTRVSVFPELIGDRCGVVIDRRAPEDVAIAIRHCLADRDRYRRMSVEAARVARGYSLERWRDAVRPLLEEAWGPLDAPGRRASPRRPG